MTYILLLLVCLSSLTQLSHQRLGDPSDLSPDQGASIARSDSTSCKRGQYYLLDNNKRVACFPCPEETYMDQDRHHENNCFPCSEAEEDNHELLKYPCTSDSNAVIDCLDNYFMDVNKHCKICKVCQYDIHFPFEAHPCKRDHNTVCCQEDGMRVEWDVSGHFYKCLAETSNSTTVRPSSENCDGSVLRNNACLAGEYMTANCSYHDALTPCKPCLAGTFINVSHHTRPPCMPCSLPQEGNLLVLSICNTTHDSVYGRHPSLPSNDSRFDNEYIIIIVVVVVVVVIVCVAAIIGAAVYRRRHGLRVGRNWRRGSMDSGDPRSMCYNYKSARNTCSDDMSSVDSD